MQDGSTARRPPLAPSPRAPVQVEPPPARLASPTVTVIIPTYREALNIAPLLKRVAVVRAGARFNLDVLFMDDQSNDGSTAAVADFGADWAQLVERTGPRGLSPAVLDGIARARGEFIVVMDADLSHPPEKIPELIRALQAGRDMAVGSRYTPGGSTGDRWGIGRRINSLVATALARPLTSVKDPMSGFFALRREDAMKAPLNPLGYKIGLELIVKCRFRDIAEVPIHFAERNAGQSKLSMRQQMLYLRHLGRLYLFRARGR